MSAYMEKQAFPSTDYKVLQEKLEDFSSQDGDLTDDDSYQKPQPTWFLPVVPQVYNREIMSKSAFRKWSEGQGCWQAWWKHWYCLSFWVGLMIMGVIFVKLTQNRSQLVEYLLWIILAVLETICFLEAFKCDVRKTLKNMKTKQNIMDLISATQEKFPVIYWKVKAWHIRDEKGHKKQRVKSNKQKTTFAYEQCQDKSPSILDQFQKYDIIKIHFLTSLTFENEETKNIYTSRREKFFAVNKTDKQVNFEEQIELEGFQEYALGISQKTQIPWWFNQFWFWIFTVLGLSWFYRLKFNSRVGEFDYTYIKMIRRNKVDIPGVTLEISAKTSPQAI